MKNDTKSMFSPEQAAARLGISRKKVYQLIRSGKLTASQFGKRTLRIRDTDLETFVSLHTLAVKTAKRPRQNYIRPGPLLPYHEYL